MIIDCLKRHNETAKTQANKGQKKKQKMQGGVFLLIEKDIEVSNDIVSGTLSLLSRKAKVLFNPNATQSFVSYVFAHYTDVPIKSVDIHVSISNPMRDCLLVDYVYKSCMIRLCDKEFLVDLYA